MNSGTVNHSDPDKEDKVTETEGVHIIKNHQVKRLDISGI